MTKLRSKKMTKSTFAVIIMAIAMVAMLAFGGTYAYFTAQASDTTRTVNTGRVQLAAGNTTEITAKVVPGQDILEGTENDISITSNSNVKTWIFVTFTTEFEQGAEGNYVTFTHNDGKVKDTKTEAPTQEGEYNLTATTSWDSFVSGDTKVYYKEVAADTTDPIAFCSALIFNGISESLNGDKGSLMDGTITITVDSAAIQYDGIDYTGAETDEAKAQKAFGLTSIKA